MNGQELKKFKKILLEMRAQLTGNVSKMEDQALRASRQSATGDLSNMPIHMADIGSDNFEREFTLDLIQNEEEAVRQIDEALERIEEGTYGVCDACGKRIPKDRLKAIPYARLCVQCKQNEEIAAGR